MTSRRILAGMVLLGGLAAGAQAAEIAAVSGAVGLEDRERMLQSYADYNLHLAFAQTDGAFVADVALAIRGADGQVMWRGVSEGPFFFARLPSGQYQVIAEYGGRELTRRVKAGATPGPMHYFHWKSALE